MSKLYFILFIVLYLSACKKEATPVVHQAGDLVSANYIATLSPQEVISNFPEQSQYAEDISGLAHYAVKLYYIEYASTYKNEPITLSGLIMVPDTTNTFPMLAYMHGTMKPYPLPNGEGNEDIPSIYKGEYPNADWKQGETRLFGSFSASHGYVTVLPDYAGYNVSSEVEHPYIIHRELARESVDMILAAQAFCQTKGVELSGKVFTSGWSEGAGASLAAQKEIEAHYSSTINHVAGAHFAGPYDMKKNGELAVLLPVLPQPFDSFALDDIMWSMYALNLFSNNPLPNDSIFNFPVTTAADVMLHRPSNVPNTLFKPSVTNNQYIEEQYYKNDLIQGWTPTSKAIFYYGSEDSNVYPFNSQNAFETFNNNGGNVALVEYVGYDHYTPVLKYYSDFITQFDLLK